MNCSICGKPIVLVPSAAKRAKKYGGQPKDYTALFTYHADCFAAKQRKETAELMRRLNK